MCCMYSVAQVAHKRRLMSYNRTYPLTKPVNTGSGASFRIGLITDMDKDSKGQLIQFAQ